jgi:hypothetical protein
VSSSSSAAETPARGRPLQALVAESFAILRREQAPRFAALLEQLSKRVVAIRSGAEEFAVDCTADDIRVVAGSPRADVSVAFEPRLISELISGQLSLHEALVSDRLLVVGPFDEVVRLNDALEMYVHAAVRSLSFPELWRRFQTELAEEERQ